MKKILFVIISCFLLVSCNFSSNSLKKYPYDYIGFYDNVTRQYISLGDTKEKTEKILGDNSNLDVYYGDDDTIQMICFFNPTVYDDYSANQYELPGSIKCTSVVTDFIDLYKNVYSDTSDMFWENAVSVFIQCTDKGNYILDKDTLIKIQNSQQDFGTIYKLSVHYSDYDDIINLSARICFPYGEDWNTTLSEVD